MYGDAITVIQLLYVRAAVDHGSFTKAAAALGVTQPALSNGIATLERLLGVELFERSRSGATLTPAGTRAFPHFLRALGGVEAAAAELRALKAEALPLRVGVSPLINAGVIARALEAASHHDLGSLVLREDDLVPLREALTRRELDLIVVPVVPVVPAAPSRNRFATRVLATEPLHYLPPSPASNTGASSADDDIELVTVAADQLVMVGDSCGLTIVTTGLFDDLGRPLRRYPGEADSYGTLQDWAALGLGGVLLPRSKFRDGVASRPVVDDGRAVLIRYEAGWDPGSATAATIEALLAGMGEPR